MFFFFLKFGFVLSATFTKQLYQKRQSSILSGRCGVFFCAAQKKALSWHLFFPAAMKLTVIFPKTNSIHKSLLLISNQLPKFNLSWSPKGFFTNCRKAARRWLFERSLPYRQRFCPLVCSCVMDSGFDNEQNIYAVSSKVTSTPTKNIFTLQEKSVFIGDNWISESVIFVFKFSMRYHRKYLWPALRFRIIIMQKLLVSTRQGKHNTPQLAQEIWKWSKEFWNSLSWFKHFLWKYNCDHYLSPLKLCADQIQTSTPHPPSWANHGHSTIFCAREVKNLTCARVGLGKLKRKCQVPNDVFFGAPKSLTALKHVFGRHGKVDWLTNQVFKSLY